MREVCEQVLGIKGHLTQRIITEYYIDGGKKKLQTGTPKSLLELACSCVLASNYFSI